MDPMSVTTTYRVAPKSVWVAAAGVTGDGVPDLKDHQVERALVHVGFCVAHVDAR
jgi:hypothetical protein